MDLVDLIRDHLNTQHEVRLEWMIIILILVEVLVIAYCSMHRWGGIGNQPSVMSACLLVHRL